MWIGKPYLIKRLNEMIDFNEALLVAAQKVELKEAENFELGKIDAYKNILEILKED